MVDELTRRAADLPQLRAHHADVTSWPADDYDVVQAVLGIFFFPDISAGTDWLISRARPGGRAAFTIWRHGAMETAGRHLDAAVAAVTRTDPPHRPSHAFNELRNADAFGSWLTKRGLSNVAVTTHELALPTTPEIAWLVVTGSGFVAALNQLDTGDVDRVRDAYLSSLHEHGVDELDATTLIGTGQRPHAG